LHENKLTGGIPKDLSKLTKLTELFLYGNKLMGTIPPDLGGLTSMIFLNLHSNKLTGCVPKCIGICSAAINENPCFITNFGNPGVTGSCAHDCPVPHSCYASLDPATTTHVDCSHKDLVGPIPMALMKLTQLEELRLEGNALTGTIPAELGDLTDLTSLNLGQTPPNQLTGPYRGITSF